MFCLTLEKLILKKYSFVSKKFRNLRCVKYVKLIR